MNMSESIKHTSDFLRSIRTNGRYAFTLEDLTTNIPKPIKNIRKDLDRLRIKGEIINIRRGFYTIIPDEYKNMGVIPVEFYIDELMKYLNKTYYVGLYSAAMFHGAAHQQPQEFYIISEKPKPRKISNDSFLINFTEKRNFPLFGIEDKKTDTGYFKMSNIELTFLDLIYFEQSVGGYNRIMSILEELSESINLTKMKEVVKNDFPMSVYQRAGFIAENVLANTKLAAVFEYKLAKSPPTTALLKSSEEKNGEKNPKWNLIINTEIESDL